jgi:hypothetical protein
MLFLYCIRVLLAYVLSYSFDAVLSLLLLVPSVVYSYHTCPPSPTASLFLLDLVHRALAFPLALFLLRIALPWPRLASLLTPSLFLYFFLLACFVFSSLSCLHIHPPLPSFLPSYLVTNFTYFRSTSAQLPKHCAGTRVLDAKAAGSACGCRRCCGSVTNPSPVLLHSYKDAAQCYNCYTTVTPLWRRERGEKPYAMRMHFPFVFYCLDPEL